MSVNEEVSFFVGYISMTNKGIVFNQSDMSYKEWLVIEACEEVRAKWHKT